MKVLEPKKYPSFNAVQLATIVKRQFKERTGKDLVLDEFNSQIFHTLCMYFTGDKRFEQMGAGYNLDKGLILFGGVGVGKTALMSLFRYNQHASYQVVNCIDITDSYSVHGAKEIDLYRSLKEAESNHPFGHQYIGYCYDDLGTETIPATYFGEKKNVLAEILLGRYARKQDYKLTHITTNLSVEEIEKNYGSRVLDRMSEMFNQITFDSSACSRRQ